MDKKATNLRQRVSSDNQHCPGGIQPTSPRTSRHLSVLSRQNLPETLAIVFPDAREHHTFCRHVHSLKRGSAEYCGSVGTVVYAYHREGFRGKKDFHKTSSEENLNKLAPESIE